MVARPWAHGGLFAILGALSLLVSGSPAEAQLVDNPQNLMKAWAEAYAKRTGEAMSRVYARDAVLWGLQSREPSVGIDSIRQHFERTGQTVVERSAVLGKIHLASRKRITQVIGTVELRSRLKDGTVRNTPARFTLSIIRESRRQWAIISHHLSPMPN